MGSMKKKWLERFRFNVRDMMKMGFPPLDKIKLVTVCLNHDGADKTNCVLHNVKLLKNSMIIALARRLWFGSILHSHLLQQWVETEAQTLLSLKRRKKKRIQNGKNTLKSIPRIPILCLNMISIKD